MVITVPYLARTPAPVGLGFNVFETGILVLPGSLLPIVVGPFAGTLVNKWGGKWPLVIGSFLLLSGFTSFYIFSTSWLEIGINQAIIGAGIGFSYTAMAAIIVHSLPRAETGVGSGVYTVMRSLGNVIGPTITAAFLLTYRAPLPIPSPGGVKMLSFPTVTAFDYIFLTTIAIAVVGLVTSLLLRGDAGKMEQSVPAEAEAPSS